MSNNPPKAEVTGSNPVGCASSCGNVPIDVEVEGQALPALSR